MKELKFERFVTISFCFVTMVRWDVGKWKSANCRTLPLADSFNWCFSCQGQLSKKWRLVGSRGKSPRALISLLLPIQRCHATPTELPLQPRSSSFKAACRSLCFNRHWKRVLSPRYGWNCNVVAGVITHLKKAETRRKEFNVRDDARTRWLRGPWGN